MSNKDEAFRLIRELLGLNEVLINELSLGENMRLRMMQDRLEDLRDVIEGMENGCNCQ